MYIGQKKNFWIVDLKHFVEGTGKREQEIENKEGIVKIHIDHLKEYIGSLGDDWFVDEMVAEGKEMMDNLFGENQYIMYSFAENDELQNTNYESIKLLEPNYMIEANID